MRDGGQDSLFLIPRDNLRAIYESDSLNNPMDSVCGELVAERSFK